MKQKETIRSLWTPTAGMLSGARRAAMLLVMLFIAATATKATAQTITLETFTYESDDVTPMSPEEGGTAVIRTGYYPEDTYTSPCSWDNILNPTNVRAVAIPNPGFRFKEWQVSDESNVSLSGTDSQEMGITSISADVTLTAVFVRMSDDYGSCGEDVTWYFESSTTTLIINGTGDMADYSDQGRQPWSSYCNDITTIVIEGSVTSIGDYAFSGCNNATNVYVLLDEDNLTLGSNAFDGISGSFYLNGDAYSNADGWKDLTNVSIIYGVCLNLVNTPDSPVFSYNGYDYYEQPATLKLEGGTKYAVIKDEDGSDVTNDVLSGSDLIVPAYNITVGQIITDNCGDSGDNVTWEYNSATYFLTISGTGAMVDFCDADQQPWHIYRNENPKIVIEDGVTHIGNYAFSGFYMTSIIIPASVTSIGNNAFDSCNDLESVSVLAPSCSLGSDAFANCISLTDIYVFSDNLEYYTTNWNSFDSSIFKAHPSWPSGDCTVSFAGTTLIVEKTDPNSATGAMADYNEADEREWHSQSDRITSIIIKDGVTHIGDYTFRYCNMPSVTIPTSVTSIGAYAFNNCSSLTSITIPASVTSIGESSFDGCIGLTSITLAEGLTTINGYAFNNCSSLTSITIPANVTTIGDGAFSGCTSLNSIIIGGNVETIGEDAFASVPENATVCVLPSTPPTLGNNAFGSNNGFKIYVPVASVDTYKRDWRIYSNYFVGAYILTYDLAGGTLPAGKSNPAFYTDEDNNNFLLNNPTKEGYAFVGWNYDRTEFGDTSNHTEVFVEVDPFWKQDYTFTATWIAEDATHKDLAKCRIEVDNPLYIGTGNYVGYYYDNGNGIKVYDGETLLTYGTDYSYSQLVSLDGGYCWDLGEHCRVLLSGDGNYVGGLSADVVIEPKTVTDASWGNLTWSLDGDGKFTITGTGAMDAAVDNSKYPWYKYCNNFTSITIGEGITSIAASAFAGTQNVRPYGGVNDINLPSSLTTIGANAFAYCSGATITVPTSVVSVGEGAFNGVVCVNATLSDAVEDNTTYLSALAGATTSNISFSRTFANGVASTLCLPFDFTPTGGTCYVFTSVNEKWTEVTMTSEASTPQANTPYLFMPTTDDEQTFSLIDGKVKSGATTTTVGDWTFTGTYAEKRWDATHNSGEIGTIFGFATGQGYDNKPAAEAAGKFIRLSSGGIKPFRAYLKYTGSLARTRGEGGLPETMTVRLVNANGEIQGIGEIRLSTGEVTFDSRAWYDLSGRRLDGKPSEKGIYINGGRKVVIK